MHIASDGFVPVLDVFRLEIQTGLVGIWYNEQIQAKGQHRDQCSREYIRNHHPVETYTTGKYGHDLRIRCHLRSKEDYRNEHEQRTEHVHEVRNEIQIIVENDLFQRSFLRYEVIDLLTDIEDDNDTDDKEQRDKEGRYEFLDNVNVKLLRSEIKIHVP